MRCASGIVVFALGIGILGYHGFEGMTWIDATLNASMILGGMGPVNSLNTEGGKLFASAYALFLVWFSLELWALSLRHLHTGCYIHSIWKLVNGND
jgi:hypothetical protein